MTALIGEGRLFLLVGGRCLNQHMVGGLWSVAGQWVVRL